MENSKIEWTTHTFNPWMGCTKVSTGCANCYAEALMDTRYGKVEWGKGKPRIRTSAANWKLPRRWNKIAGCFPMNPRPRVFCASLADWLDDEVPLEWLYDLLKLIRITPNLDWLLLTKRLDNFYSRLSEIMGLMGNHLTLDESFLKVFILLMRDGWQGTSYTAPEIGKENYWIGTSAEDQERWDERLPQLMNIRARVHFVSAEPLLGPICMGKHRPEWLIVGGESGPGARYMQTGWAESLQGEAEFNGTAFLFKQWGGADKKSAGRLLHGQTYDELPSPLPTGSPCSNAH